MQTTIEFVSIEFKELALSTSIDKFRIVFKRGNE